MPVVNISSSRLGKLIPNVSRGNVLEILPFAGLDIEGVDEHGIRVEYNPNRPDFSTDLGIIRAIRGLLEIELGTPRLKLAKSGHSILVTKHVKKIRPVIVALVASGGRLEHETIRQLIAMQEDLHNGIGRRRRKASIGLHDLDTISFPLTYTAVNDDYAFTPLGESSRLTIAQILEGTETGRQYGNLVRGFDLYPLLIDKNNTVLSFPPVINGDSTRVDSKTRNILVEVTGTDGKISGDVLAIVAMTLAEAGFRIGTVTIAGGKRIETPDMKPTRIIADAKYLSQVMGIELGSKQIIRCLEKSRLDATARGKSIVCMVPRYRTDISHPVDLAEEVALGYGIYKLKPTFPSTSTAGQKSSLTNHLSAVRETLVGHGMIESLGFSLTSREVQYESWNRSSDNALQVEAPKSVEHQILRDSLIPSLLFSLSRNVHEEYPQQFFEIGKAFHRDGDIRESWNVAAAVAHVDASYTEIMSISQSLLRSCFGKEMRTKASQNPFFVPGRSAEIVVAGTSAGAVGEIAPAALANMKLRVPAAAFEIDLSRILDDKGQIA
jgi:phenylalanyl-tRNA synthetase beta chain